MVGTSGERPAGRGGPEGLEDLNMLSSVKGTSLPAAGLEAPEASAAAPRTLRIGAALAGLPAAAAPSRLLLLGRPFAAFLVSLGALAGPDGFCTNAAHTS